MGSVQAVDSRSPELHMTLVWFKEGAYGTDGNPPINLAIAVREMRARLPFIATVYEIRNDFGRNKDVRVAKLALPHHVHAARFSHLGLFDESDWLWEPHVTLPPQGGFEPIYAGHKFCFDIIELCRP